MSGAWPQVAPLWERNAIFEDTFDSKSPLRVAQQKLDGRGMVFAHRRSEARWALAAIQRIRWHGIQ